MIAIVILMVGILSMLSGIAAAVLQSRGQQQQLTAKHIAASTLESIMAAKETDPARLGWRTIGNVGSNPDSNGVPQGIFVVGFQPVMSDAGADEVVGTADDAGNVIDGFQREIVITDECDLDRPSPNCATPGTWAVRIRSVRITVTYFAGTMIRQERINTVLTDYATQ
jgi:hypothetical protein